MIEKYRDWNVDYAYFGYGATHGNYDASWEGEEIGYVGSHPFITADTLEGLREEIDCWYEEQGCPFCEGTGRCHNNGEMDSPMWVVCECGEAS